MKKAQISLEFFFAIGAIFILFLIVLAFSISRRTELLETESYLEAKDECLRVSNLISFVYIGGNGVIIGSKTNHRINITNSTDENYKGEILVENLVEGHDNATCFYTALQANNTILNGNFQIKNRKDMVVVENV